MPQVDDLILFTQVVEHGSFSKAAEHNHFTKSMISKRVSKLESDLGTQLLYRTTRKLTLTEAGEMLYHRSKDIYSTANAAFKSITGYNESLAGHIRMSVPTISGELLLAESISEFCNNNPGLTVDMSMDNHFVDLIEDNYDLVIRTGYLEDSSLIARYIFSSRWMICASPQYLEKHGEPKTPKALQRHNCLGYTHETGGTFNWQFKCNSDNYTFKVSGNFSSDNAGALRKSAISGNGLAYLPTCLIYQDLQQGKLVEVLSEHTSKEVGIYAVYPYTRNPAKRIQALIEHIRESYLTIQERF